MIRLAALALLQALLERGLPPELGGGGWLWHQHSATALSGPAKALLQQAEQAGLELVRLEGEAASRDMGQWLDRCPVELLAYDPSTTASAAAACSGSGPAAGPLWGWAGARQARATG